MSATVDTEPDGPPPPPPKFPMTWAPRELCWLCRAYAGCADEGLRWVFSHPHTEEDGV